MFKYAVRSQIVNACRYLSERGLVSATEGNVSAIIDHNRIVITPGGFRKGLITRAHLVEIDSRDGKKIKGRFAPTSELHSHLALYERFPGCGAIVHAHPVYTLTCVLSGLYPPPAPLLPESVLFLKHIAVLPYARPSTPESAAVFGQLPADCSGAVINRHGAFIMGRHVEEALCRLDAPENTCRFLYLNYAAGLHPQALEQPEIDALSRLNYTIKG